MKLTALAEIEVPEDLGGFQELEGKIRSVMFEVGRELLAQLLDLYESRFFEQGVRVIKQDRKEKWFRTVAGEIRKSRWRVWDLEGQRYRYPLDEWLGLKGRSGMTPTFQRTSVQIAVQRPFRQAAREMQTWTGVAVSPISLWKTTQRLAQEDKAKEKPIPDWYLKPLPSRDQRTSDPCPLLAIDPDATYCHNQSKEAKDHEVKIAVLYTGKEPEGRNNKRWKLQNRQVVISKPAEDPRNFFNRVTLKAMSDYGAHRDTQVIIHGDGDPWIKSLKTNYWDQALIRLDPWHVAKRIVGATGEKEIPSSWWEAIYGNPDRLILLLRMWRLRKTKPRSDARQKMEELIQYIRNNRDGLLPSGVSPEIKEKYPRMFKRGSGTIESHVGHAFASRFKQPRMSWSKQGLENLCYLREKFLNGNLKPRYHVPEPLTRKVA